MGANDTGSRPRKQASDWIAHSGGQGVIDFTEHGMQEDSRLIVEDVLDNIGRVLLNGSLHILNTRQGQQKEYQPKRLEKLCDREIRPMFHSAEKRIESHVCVCFVANKLYKELDGY